VLLQPGLATKKKERPVQQKRSAAMQTSPPSTAHTALQHFRRVEPLRRLAVRIGSLADFFQRELGVACRPLFDARARALFPSPAQPVAECPLLSDVGLSLSTALDYMMLVASNVVIMGVPEYRLFYWTCQLLEVADATAGRRLQQALEVHGFVFSKDVAGAVERMKSRARRSTLWEKLRHNVEQLCVALSEDSPTVIAGVYNDIIVKCSLPDIPMYTATLKDMRRLVAHYYDKPSYRKDLIRYVDKYTGGNRAHTITVNGDTQSVSVMLEDHMGGAATTPQMPMFSCPQACVECLVRCAQKLFLPAKQVQTWAWYRARYSVAVAVAAPVAVPELHPKAVAAPVPELDPKPRSKK
jgi:hypothetical protein